MVVSNPLHQVDLKIVKEVIKICEEYNLSYYALGGTMLGAIRHRGFIPWDDDIDLGMPRKDYEKFLKVAPIRLSEELKIVNYKNTPEYQYYITRVLDTTTQVVEERIGNSSKYTHASIDIFPIDGTPNNIILRKIYYLRVLYHRAMMSLCYKDSIDRKRKRGFAEKILLGILEKIPIEKITSPYKEKEKIDKLLSKQDIESSKLIGNIMGAYRTREIVPKEWYGEGTKYQFEDIKIVGLDMYDEYLTYTYGDYMQLPSEDCRKTHFKVINIEEKNGK
ncbi:LicD family protein [Streptococcus suis]|uniref:LicD family protein n=1 Tax=Streptococcus suivaginalis TaxID=3028082 RepID=A0AA96VDG4_9STRE|nr:LicD family protein [Streptococcus sp. 29896]MCK4027110.1 LicD family protein [Streptococcus suis]WNY47692.1 LicD family protein [Streptococcus sp. 29896]